MDYKTAQGWTLKFSYQEKLEIILTHIPPVG